MSYFAVGWDEPTDSAYGRDALRSYGDSDFDCEAAILGGWLGRLSL